MCARNERTLALAAEGIRKQHSAEVLDRALDVTDAAAVRQFVEAVVAKFGAADICVTNAGGPPAKGFLAATVEDWHKAVEANFMSTVHFAREAGPDRVVAAMQAFKGVLRERPGGTKVVVHVPAPGGAALPMELKGGVAYDAELVAEVRRRIGEGVVDLQLL